ncbi:Uncharacterized protein DAT39_011760, partial [Clarias magur]
HLPCCTVATRTWHKHSATTTCLQSERICSPYMEVDWSWFECWKNGQNGH